MNKVPRMTKELNEKMSEAARIARNKYQQQWRQQNPEKVRAIVRRHWEKKAQAKPAEEG